MQPHNTGTSDDASWLDRGIAWARGVADMPGHVDAQVTQTNQLLQHAIDQAVFWMKVLGFSIVAVIVVLIIAQLYRWNLYRRDVVAEEDNAKAMDRLAEAMERIADSMAKK